MYKVCVVTGHRSCWLLSYLILHGCFTGLFANNNIPTAIFFALLNGATLKLQGVVSGTVPVFPLTKKFKLGTKPGTTIKRTQFSLAPAYAFTDFKAQGQTMETVIVNLAKPPIELVLCPVSMPTLPNLTGSSDHGPVRAKIT